MQSIIAAGGVVYKKEKDDYYVLLIYRNGVWDLPKGKQEEGESKTECARREVAEEVGIPLPEVTDFLKKTRHSYKRSGKKYGKITYWYSMKTPVQDDFSPQKKEGIEKVSWVSFDEALQRVGYTNLKKVLKAFKKSI